MALVTQKFFASITDETDPTTTQEINFTDDSKTNYSVSTITLLPFDAVTYSSWKKVPANEILNVSTKASYVIVKTDNPIYVWIGREPARDAVTGEIDETITPKFTVSKCLVLSGEIDKIYAINPSSTASAPSLTAHIKITYVY